ncbi:large conductance mechanosensitive channel protein MscL [Ilumatobacter coccineus]|uniref:Large-conductance mechanosensitive channel n=1 Tax=Ilumatobacter coccineus (strain NBRC 103263 / KCTC 29153 / YM16-304) TaxID=1313172 RepID=A0A6C7E559_ILUCY|nr:large conductance mechanosensitive channel protein MscL [Ilumatobacter coccineus]BAN01700.1 large-conductance mechanosensitive channel MscL [Ilumatobacter coccineus YM16-304]
MLQEFKDFITKGNLIDLAIAVVLATFFAPVITAIVDGVILNLVAAIFGKPNFDEVARIKISDGDGDISIDPDTGLPIDPATYLEFGKVITALITFVIVGFVCFLIVKAYNKMVKEEEEEESGPSEVDLLTEIRDQLKANN